MKEVQFIEKNGKPEWAIVPYKEYIQLIEDSEDNNAMRDFKKKIGSGEEEYIPAKYVDRIIDGENPIKVLREYRGINQAELARNAKISAPFLSQLENNEREGGTSTLKKIAKALNVSLDDIT